MAASVECMDASSAVVPEDMCSWYQQTSEEFDDRCIILIQYFGGYSVLEVLHVRETLEKCCMQILHGVCMELHGTCMELHVA